MSEGKNPQGQGKNPQGPGGGPKEAMKTRLPVSEMKGPIEAFCESQKEMYIAVNNGSDFPDLEVVEYRYVQGTHLLVLTPASMFLTKFKTGDNFTGFIFDKEGRGLKMTKRVYGKYTCEELKPEGEFLQKVGETDELVKRMLTHGAKFFTLTPKEMTIYFGGQEIFSLDKDMNPSFAKFAPNGKERFEHSHHVLMEYEGREVIFNTLIENGVYYTLTKAESNKMTYIKNGGECQFFDGRDNHFTSKMTVLPEEKVQEIFDKLVATNHCFFKSTDGLVALSYQKES